MIYFLFLENTTFTWQGLKNESYFRKQWNCENFCGQEKIDSDLQFWYFSYGVCQILVGVLTSESGKPRKNGLYEGYTLL